MNWDTVKGNWKQFTGKVRDEWGDLTDDEVEQTKGDRDQLAGKVQERYGLTKEEANKQVDDWASKH
ncbi:CsbD family protein [soil metagenome]